MSESLSALPILATDTRTYFISELLKFNGDIDLSPEAFLDVTGVNLNRIRRGRAKGPFVIPLGKFAIMDRCSRLYQFALSLRGDRENAQEWMFSNAPALDGARPIDLTRTPKSFALVEHLISVLNAAATHAETSPPSHQSLSSRIPDPEKNIVSTPIVLRPLIAPVLAQVPERASPSAALSSAPNAGNTRKLRIAERLKEGLARNPSISKSEVARRMQKLGFPKISASSLSRFSIGYEASWPEIVAIATILEVRAEWLSDANANTPAVP